MLSVALFTLSATAQFQFFEQMFQGQQQHHQPQQAQNVASDSNWYQQNYEAGELSNDTPSDGNVWRRFFTTIADSVSFLSSSLYKLPLPGNPRLRALSTSLSMPVSNRGRQI